VEARVHTTVQERSLESLCSRSLFHAWVHAARKADAVHSWLEYGLRSRRHQQCVIPKKRSCYVGILYVGINLGRRALS
jgi:hypothetical protein